ncbi:hypothetical protein V8E53_003803 [Lactarius tabidus]
MPSPVSGILPSRGFNIYSLVVVHAEIRDLSCMCIAISGQDDVIEQACRKLEDFVRYGRSELHGDAYDLAQVSPRQSVHSRARLLRGPTGRRTLRTGRSPRKRGQRSGFMKPFIRSDSLGRNEICLSCGRDNGLVALCAWNLHARLYCPATRTATAVLSVSSSVRASRFLY